MTNVLRRVWLATLMLTLSGAAMVGCGDDDSSTENPQEEGDAGVNDSGSGGAAGTRSSAGRGGSGGSGGVAGRRGGAGGAGGGTAGTRSTGTNAGTSAAGTSASAGTSAAAGVSGAGNGGEAGTGGDAAEMPSDAQIVAIVNTANSGEIELGNLALRQASSPTVRAFAQMMVTMHTAAQARQTNLLSALNLTAEDNPRSMQLRQETMTASTRLQPLTGPSFDLAYIESQVTMHMAVLALLDDVLLPSVDAAALRADLVIARAEVATHLAEARLLLAALQSDQDAGVDDSGI